MPYRYRRISAKQPVDDASVSADQHRASMTRSSHRCYERGRCILGIRRPMAAASDVDEEKTTQGIPTGLEAEDTGDIEQPFDPEDIDVITKPMTVDLLLSRIGSHAINLQPDFQRRWGIWDAKRQSRLIESLLLRIPVPSLYAAEDADDDWEIVDGVQRLYTICHFIEASVIDESALSLTGLKTLGTFNGRTFTSLPPKLQRRLRETELVVHVIRKGTPSLVKYSIFERINTGSVVLSAQELRHAITRGRARGLLADWASSNEFKQATDNSVRSDRMGDRELVLRFIAFRLTPSQSYKTADFDGFLLRAMEELNTLPKERLETLRLEFTNAMEAAVGIFGIDAFRKRYSHGSARHPINKALFETISVNLAAASGDMQTKLIAQAERVRNGILELCNDRSFEAAISQGTGDVAKVRRRFEMVAGLFERVSRHA